ncbi:stealth family protein [Streptomyces sp. NPDC059979]|uniref:stealth family protein n=1 Tax=unclassified Streptomyces TaxID=2593676 RepID=UPI003668F4EC
MGGLSRIPFPAGLRRAARAALHKPSLVARQPVAPQSEQIPGSGTPKPSRSREDELLEALPGVVRYRGRLARVRDDLLPPDVREANLRTAAEALEAAGIAYGLVPDGGLAHRVAISPGDRDAGLKAWSHACAGLPVYAQLLGDRGELGEVLAEALPEAVAAKEAERRPDAGPADEDPYHQVKGIRLYEPAVTSGRTLYFGPDHGCDLEFWEHSDSGTGGVAALRECPYGWWLPSLTATIPRRVGLRDYPVIDLLARGFPHDIDFPIDAVITWVDDADPAWRRRRDLAAADTDSGARSCVDHAEHRYRDRGELRYCLRSIAAYAPWVRRIFLVTDDQIPSWLATSHPQITVVQHRELFAEADRPPVFNSHAIESRLHLIPGLSEHFLYFNDDIFLGRPQQPQNYFLPSGLPKVFHDSRAVPPGVPDGMDDVFTASQKTTRQAVEEAVGRVYPHILAHAPYPLRRSLFAHVEDTMPGLLSATSRSVFRSATDVAPVTLAAHLGLADGQAVMGELAHAYISTGRADEIERLSGMVHDRWPDAFCLADDESITLSAQEQQRVVTTFLEAYFPVASPYERA